MAGAKTYQFVENGKGFVLEPYKLNGKDNRKLYGRLARLEDKIDDITNLLEDAESDLEDSQSRLDDAESWQESQVSDWMNGGMEYDTAANKYYDEYISPIEEEIAEFRGNVVKIESQLSDLKSERDEVERILESKGNLFSKEVFTDNPPESWNGMTFANAMSALHKDYPNAVFYDRTGNQKVSDSEELTTNSRPSQDVMRAFNKAVTSLDKVELKTGIKTVDGKTNLGIQFVVPEQIQLESGLVLECTGCTEKDNRLIALYSPVNGSWSEIE